MKYLLSLITSELKEAVCKTDSEKVQVLSSAKEGMCCIKFEFMHMIGHH